MPHPAGSVWQICKPGILLLVCCTCQGVGAEVHVKVGGLVGGTALQLHAPVPQVAQGGSPAFWQGPAPQHAWEACIAVADHGALLVPVSDPKAASVRQLSRVTSRGGARAL